MYITIALVLSAALIYLLFGLKDNKDTDKKNGLYFIVDNQGQESAKSPKKPIAKLAKGEKIGYIDTIYSVYHRPKSKSISLGHYSFSVDTYALPPSEGKFEHTLFVFGTKQKVVDKIIKQIIEALFLGNDFSEVKKTLILNILLKPKFLLKELNCVFKWIFFRKNNNNL